MRTFKVFRHPEPALGFQAVKVGFSWPGFFIPVIWLLCKKLWVRAVIIFLCGFLLSALQDYALQEPDLAISFLISLLGIGISLFVGFNGNKWHESNLLKRGFELIDTLQAPNPDAAVAIVAKAIVDGSREESLQMPAKTEPVRAAFDQKSARDTTDSRAAHTGSQEAAPKRESQSASEQGWESKLTEDTRMDWKPSHTSKMAKLDSILATTKSAQWHNPSRVQQMLEPIKNTWGVDCKIIELDEPQVQLIERLHPLDTDFQHINGQYQYKISSNSIFVHPYGSWLNFGYLKFWYSGCIYYVNVAPMVDLTPEFYERSDDLSHIAKIMLALGELDRPDRKSVMIILDGELKQEE